MQENLNLLEERTLNIKSIRLFAVLVIIAVIITLLPMTSFAASTNTINKVPQVTADYEFTALTAPVLMIAEKNADDFSTTSGETFRLSLTNAEWLPGTPEAPPTPPRTVYLIEGWDANNTVKFSDNTTTVDYVYGVTAVNVLTKTTAEVTIVGTTGSDVYNLPLYTKVTGEGEAQVTVDARDSRLSSGTYVFANSATGGTVASISKVTSFTRTSTDFGTIQIDETRVGTLTGDQTIRITLPPKFEWVIPATAEATFSGGFSNPAMTSESFKGDGERTLELTFTPSPATRTARGSIILKGLQIKADMDAPGGEVVVNIEGTSVTAQELVVAKHESGNLAEAHLVGTISGTKKFPAIGIWEYEFNSAGQIWALELSVIEEANDGHISRNFTTMGSYSGAAKGKESFTFIHAAEMKMLLGGLEHTVYAFAWGDVSVFEVAFLPDTEDSKQQFFSIFGLDHESALGYIKNIIANSDDVVYGTPSIIYLQGQPVSPVATPYLIQVSANPAAGGTVTGYGIYKYGNNITVTATPNNGYMFDNWSENGTVVSTNTAYTFNVTGNRKLTANFSKISTPSSSGGGGGGGEITSPPVQKQEKKPEPEKAAPAVTVEAESLAREITTKDGKIIESFTVREEAIEQIEKARKEGKTAVEIKIEKSEASVVAVSVPKDVLESIGEMNLIINTPGATLELPKELVQAIKAAGQDLSIHVESGDTATVSEQMADVPEAAGAEILGTPTVINAEIRGYTNVSIPLSGIEIPKSAAERQAFLDTLRIFAVHSDGEKKIVEGTIEYDAAGNPISINFTVDKFSTFAVIKVPETARIGEPLEIKLIIGQLNAVVNGEGCTLDAEPFLKPEINRTMVPVRFICEAFGVEVIWVDERRQVMLKDPYNIIILTIDSDKVLVDNNEKVLDCPAEMLPPGRTFVPLRFVSENLGAKVFYNTDK
ncbi:MAG: copper amine oxidase N-terminal domain-containing protein, partial [Firmicutes bacterium]|nr:copper amine oxidase N-terminal domain-containing protein [Bacillota bacterium]